MSAMESTLSATERQVIIVKSDTSTQNESMGNVEFNIFRFAV